MNSVYSRIAFYFLAGGAFALSAAGLADYDSATMTLDIRPIDLKEAALYLSAMGGSVASVAAVFKRWGTK